MRARRDNCEAVTFTCFPAILGLSLVAAIRWVSMYFYARVLALVGRMARARRVPEPGAPVPAWTQRLAKRLDRYSDEAGLPLDLSRELSELEGYFSGLRLAYDRDIGNAGISL